MQGCPLQTLHNDDTVEQLKCPHGAMDSESIHGMNYYQQFSAMMQVRMD